MNIALVKNILTNLAAVGVREIIVCAGARNSPFVAVLDQVSGVQVYSFFEERSAAFFALGCARRLGSPVAVITTSGTAAAELLPAAVEAYYSGVPLLLVTADRPRRLRNSGAPQAIDQTGLFQKFVSYEVDIEGAFDGTEFLRYWDRRAPAHLNVCLDEPLLDEPIRPWELEPQASSLPAVVPDVRYLRAFLTSVRQPIAIVATLVNEEERLAVRELLLRLKIPVYLEATSGLREDPGLQDFVLRSGDKILNYGLSCGAFDSVLRLGGIPTVRVWRDLEEASCHAQVFSLTALPFAGLSRGECLVADLSLAVKTLLSDSFAVDYSYNEMLLRKDRLASSNLQRLLDAEPASEPALFQAFSLAITSGDLVYIGNSLPIREWDLAASYSVKHWVRANRGVNGIDGQLSTFMGLSEAGREAWAIVGDLTALYDLTAPWVLTAQANRCLHLVVINNGGGKIFSRIFNSALFENRHEIEFSAWAQMWKLPYQKWTSVSSAPAETGVIEIVPDALATKRFWDAYDSMWKTL